jgi:hypothetical protein
MRAVSCKVFTLVCSPSMLSLLKILCNTSLGYSSGMNSTSRVAIFYLFNIQYAILYPRNHAGRRHLLASNVLFGKGDKTEATSTMQVK